MARTLAIDPNEVLPHPTAAKPGYFPNDDALRLSGFVIADRPNKGPAMWRKGGVKFTEKEALLRLEDVESPR